MNRFRVVVMSLAAGAMLLSACSGDGDSSATTTAAPTVAATSEATREATVGVTSEATSGATASATSEATGVVSIGPVRTEEALRGTEFDAPIEFGAYGGRLFVADQSGVVWLFDTDGTGRSTLLDIRDRVVYGGEQGLLSVAFAPTGELWAYYSAAGPRRTVLSRFSVVKGVADPASELVVLGVEQPYANHNGGAVRFGPEGLLYLGLGDGGSADDPLGSGQDLSTLLGKIIRLDVHRASAAERYVAPSDNPFVEVEEARPEIWALGLRNPWRMAFDDVTGELWVGDVGQNRVEEIDVVRAGRNYGWDIAEGNICHEPSEGCDSSGLTPPVATYRHGEGRCSVTGGVVYRGSAVAELAGAYVFGDYCTGEVWAVPADRAADEPAEPVLVASDLGNISSFGVDAAGEVYVVRFGGSIVRLVSP